MDDITSRRRSQEALRQSEKLAAVGRFGCGGSVFCLWLPFDATQRPAASLYAEVERVLRGGMRPLARAPQKHVPRILFEAMSNPFEQAQAAAAHISALSPEAPAVGIILGSGLGNFAGHVCQPIVIPYGEIPHFPQSTVVGHSGKLVLGNIGGVPVAVLQGRVHAYEGYSMPEVIFPTRVLGLLGCRTLIVTNAAGGIRADLPPGGLVVLSDHINLTGTNAALGPNEPRFAVRPGAGERFFDMTTAYSPNLRSLAQAEAAKQGISLPEGVYLAVLGPSYETPAEIRAFRTLGADMVGMSTVHEVIAARHMGIEVLGLSLVTNMAAGVTDEAISHEDVMAIGRQVEAQFTGLLTALIPAFAGPR